jgi:hypothetical protein
MIGKMMVDNRNQKGFTSSNKKPGNCGPVDWQQGKSGFTVTGGSIIRFLTGSC